MRRACRPARPPRPLKAKNRRIRRIPPCVARPQTARTERKQAPSARVGLREKCDSGAVRPSSYSGEGRTAPLSHFSPRTTRALGACFRSVRSLTVTWLLASEATCRPCTTRMTALTGAHRSSALTHPPRHVPRQVLCVGAANSARFGGWGGAARRMQRHCRERDWGAESAGSPSRKVTAPGGSTLSRSPSQITFLEGRPALSAPASAPCVPSVRVRRKPECAECGGFSLLTGAVGGLGGEHASSFHV